MTRSDVIAAAAAARRVACRHRPVLLTAAVWLWWALFPPRGLGDVVAGAAVLVLVHRLMAAPRVRDRRRAGRSGRVSGTPKFDPINTPPKARSTKMLYWNSTSYMSK